MAAKIRGDPKKFDNFAEKIMSPSFQAQLKRAVEKPNSKEARKVFNTLTPVLTSGGKKTTCGALERRSAAGEILSMGRRYGPASCFLTVSVDDVNSPGVFGMSFRSKDNLSFPAHCPESLLKAIELGEDYVPDDELLGSGEIRIPCDWKSLAKAATENPVSVAIHYNKLIYDILRIIVGIKPGTTCGNNNRALKTEYRGFGEDSKGVVSGTPAALTGVTETTARGGLHFHAGKLFHVHRHSFFPIFLHPTMLIQKQNRSHRLSHPSHLGRTVA